MSVPSNYNTEGAGDSLLPSLIRTWVPLIVALIGPWVTQYVGLSDDRISSVAAAAIAGVYYLVIRLLERYFPQFGWLLGWAKQPTYPTTLHR